MSNQTISKVLILGSGGLRIGQAGEFDYSGSQAIKALKQEGITSILLNPNIATVQSDIADIVYLQPLNVETVQQILEKERPCGILFGFGGQTALNLGLKLDEEGLLEKYGVRVLGSSLETIRKTEDRELFKKALEEIDVKTAKSFAVDSVEEAVFAAKELGYPIMLRSAYSLGGLGSGKILDEGSLRKRACAALQGAPQILIEEYLEGWKEIEYEIVRDQDDNSIVVCNMENFDPMGIHTGESMVVAPSQTLNNEEYHLLREIAIRVARHLKVLGECNIQYALDPQTGDYRVIEMNARLSRSSALASKATGYPLAFVAAKLSLGIKLHEIKNQITKKTSAFFEPALDYLVLKMPRWDIAKLQAAEHQIGTEMKSVGEVMAIGRSFSEALQKAIRMLNISCDGLYEHPFSISCPKTEIEYATDRRIFAIYEALKQGMTVDAIYELSKIDQWFLKQIEDFVNVEKKVQEAPLKQLRLAKEWGFSDAYLAKLCHKSVRELRKERIAAGVVPFVLQIDTLAGEFDAQTNYLYMTYHAARHDLSPNSKAPVIVLGSGPYCIGSSVEFDWCAVNTVKTLRKMQEYSVMINSNPETVSTDYDESNRLYFEELSLERVQDIADFEQPKGLVVSVGGQIANNLAPLLDRENYPVLGTPAECIDRAENRQKFSSLLNQLEIDQPAWQKVSNLENAKAFAREKGYPLLVRPSYVLSGASMQVVYGDKELKEYLDKAVLSSDKPAVLSKFILDAKELEVDGVAKDGKILIEAIAEHIENAGVHSGDAHIVLPPQRLYLETIRRTKKITREIVKVLKITGPFNLQFIAKENEIKVIECNLRASRSLPFVSKVTHKNFIEIATKALLGKVRQDAYQTLDLDYVAVKSPQFSYQRLKGANPVAHVEMSSTGEVACFGENYLEAFYQSWKATEQELKGKRMLVSVGGNKKVKLLDELKVLEEKGWEIYSTGNTHDFLSKHGIGSIFLYKASDKVEPNVLSFIEQQKLDLIINIPRQSEGRNLSDGYVIRRSAIDHHLPLISNLQIAQLFLKCLIELEGKEISVKAWKEYVQAISVCIEKEDYACLV